MKDAIGVQALLNQEEKDNSVVSIRLLIWLLLELNIANISVVIHSHSLIHQAEKGDSVQSTRQWEWWMLDLRNANRMDVTPRLTTENQVIQKAIAPNIGNQE